MSFDLIIFMTRSDYVDGVRFVQIFRRVNHCCSGRWQQNRMKRIANGMDCIGQQYFIGFSMRIRHPEISAKFPKIIIDREFVEFYQLQRWFFDCDFCTISARFRRLRYIGIYETLTAKYRNHCVHYARLCNAIQRAATLSFHIKNVSDSDQCNGWHRWWWCFTRSLFYHSTRALKLNLHRMICNYDWCFCVAISPAAWLSRFQTGNKVCHAL